MCCDDYIRCNAVPVVGGLTVDVCDAVAAVFGDTSAQNPFLIGYDWLE
jgi:hypothetical protein